LQENRIPLVAGFQGINSNGEITTFGRNGSDITALALGTVFEAEKIEMFKDTQGVQTLDPSRYRDAKSIPFMTFEEAGEMADEGAKVLHKRCIALAAQNEIAIRVKNLKNDKFETCIDKTPDHLSLENYPPVTAVVDIPGFSQFRLDLQKNGLEKTRIFKILAEQEISLDMINICEDRLYFTVKTEQTEKTENLLLSLKHDFRIIPDLSKIAIIGVGMKGTPGVMAKIQDCLTQAGVANLHSTDSHISISCLVRNQDREKAVMALKEGFNL